MHYWIICPTENGRCDCAWNTSELSSAVARHRAELLMLVLLAPDSVPDMQHDDNKSVRMHTRTDSCYNRGVVMLCVYNIGQSFTSVPLDRAQVY